MFDEEGQKLIREARRCIKLDRSIVGRSKMIDDAMRAVYKHYSSYTEDMFNEAHNGYQCWWEIYLLENELLNEYMDIDSSPVYSSRFSKKLPREIRNDKDCETILDYIVYLARSELAKDSDDFMSDPLKGQCLMNASYLFRILQRKEFTDLGIEACFIMADNDFTAQSFHCFVIVNFQLSNGINKNYIVDCTYRQFFTKKEGYIERLGLPSSPLDGCSPGVYMTMSKDRMEKAVQILKYGYIEATPENLKDYFDAIIFSGRGRKFYEENNLDYYKIEDCTPDYSLDWYREMILKYQEVSSDLLERIFNETIEDCDITLSEYSNCIGRLQRDQTSFFSKILRIIKEKF